MRLELGSFPVERIAFGARTEWRDGSLTVAREELLRVVAGDPAFRSVGVELASPGEDARIVHVLDAVEPRVKVRGPGTAYSGHGGSVEVTGEGRTHRLKDAAVLATCEVPWSSRGGLLIPREGIVEMRGEAAMFSPFASTHNVVLVLDPAPDRSDDEYEKGARNAALRVAEYLGACVASSEPPELEVFELGTAPPGLPRVAYVYQIHSQGLWAQTFLYGETLDGQLPTLIHPNEVLDGALVSGNQVYQNHKIPTWLHANNPVIRALYRRHGREVDFAGVVLTRGYFYTDTAKARSANLAARLASLLGADGVVITWEGGGNSMVEAMLTLRACERRGIKTCLLSYEMADAEGGSSLLFALPEADALVSTGNTDEVVRLPAVSRVIGGDTIRLRPEVGGVRLPAHGAIELDFTYELYCGANRLGAGRLQAGDA